MATITLFPWRGEIDGEYRSVTGVSFAYDSNVVAAVKDSLRQARWSIHSRDQKMGGWLPEHRIWWVDPQAEFTFTYWLKRAGYVVCKLARGYAGTGADYTEEETNTSVDVTVQRFQEVVKSWYREMILKYHPDRTLDDGKAMAAINFAHERLRELLDKLEDD